MNARRRRIAAALNRPAAFVESLESRRLLATFTVTAGGDGAGFTLRSAVNLANTTAGPDTIQFDPALFSPGGAATTIVAGNELVFNDTTGKTTVVGPSRAQLAISGNKARRPIRILAGSDVEFRSLTIRDSFGSEGGGAITLTGATLTLRDVVMTANQSSIEGGAVIATGSQLNIESSEFSSNLGPTYAVATINSNLVINNSRFVNSAAGGGLYSLDTNATISNSTFSGNGSGGVYIGAPTSSSHTVVRDSTFEGNGTSSGLITPAILASSGGQGSSTVALTNVTVVGNLSGGVSLTNIEATLTHVTIARNASRSTSSGMTAGLNLNGGGPLVTLRNTLIVGNTRPEVANGPSIVAADIAGTVGNASNTLVSDPASAGGIVHGINGNIVGNGAGAALAATAVVASNASDNGGPVRTIALVKGSPALNAGNAAFTAGLPFDARGSLYARIVADVPDIGAFEVQDLLAPSVFSGRFDVDGVNAPGFPHRLTLQFSEIIDAGTLTASDLVVKNLTTDQFVPTANTLLSWDPIAARATLVFPGYVRSVLPDGQYRVTVAAGSVADGSGNLLTGPFTFDFYVLTGDLNRDRSVNFGDLLTLAKNYNQDEKTFAQGNVDYDAQGEVNFTDLLMLAKQYNVTLPDAHAAPAIATATASTPTRRRTADDVLA